MAQKQTWNNIRITILGFLQVDGVNFSYEGMQEKEYYHGAGAEPLGIVRGKRTYKFTFATSEAGMQQISAVSLGILSILDYENFTITRLVSKTDLDPVSAGFLNGCEFTKEAVENNSGDLDSKWSYEGISTKQLVRSPF